jgi:hypothetical protein
MSWNVLEDYRRYNVNYWNMVDDYLKCDGRE